jgi:hypothetical protein
MTTIEKKSEAVDFDEKTSAISAYGTAHSTIKGAPLTDSDHILRVLTARWLGLEPGAGRYFILDASSFSALGYEHNRSQPIIQLWNDTLHLMHH